MNTQPKLAGIVAVVYLCCFSLVSYSQGAKNKNNNNLTLVFENKVGNDNLVLDKDYTNPFGEMLSVHKFRYYITQLQMVDSADMSVQFFADSYFLIDAGDSTTRTITIPLSIKHISSISFLMGVDSSVNVSGTQEGALDPSNGMFWTWNTGYIVAKLEGKSPAANAPGSAYTYNVGGFKPGENASRLVQFATKLPKKAVAHTIVFNVDINKWFNGAHDIKIADHAMCHEPGPLMQMADNYATMFSIQQITK